MAEIIRHCPDCGLIAPLPSTTAWQAGALTVLTYVALSGIASHAVRPC